MRAHQGGGAGRGADRLEPEEALTVLRISGNPADQLVGRDSSVPVLKKIEENVLRACASSLGANKILKRLYIGNRRQGYIMALDPFPQPFCQKVDSDPFQIEAGKALTFHELSDTVVRFTQIQEAFERAPFFARFRLLYRTHEIRHDFGYTLIGRRNGFCKPM